MSSPRETEFINDIVSKAALDAGFRQGLLTDARSAIKGAYGIEVPEHFRIRFVERDSDVDAMVVLPDLLVADGELAPEELEAVAGGVMAVDGDCNWTCGCTKTEIST